MHSLRFKELERMESLDQRLDEVNRRNARPVDAETGEEMESAHTDDDDRQWGDDFLPER